jgi:NAD(P)-dependent dehydrogenase (short-subunit alcohol dehydrogenase family)
LGRAIATTLVDDGFALALADGNEAVHGVAEALREAGAEVFAVQYDVADAQAARDAHVAARAVLGDVTVVVTAAAIVDQIERAWKFTAEWEREIESTFQVRSRIGPALLRSGPMAAEWWRCRQSAGSTASAVKLRTARRKPD